jgi:Vitamin K-dependent carboxylation/gamma-carboxyglutamic (GLA) domain
LKLNLPLKKEPLSPEEALEIIDQAKKEKEFWEKYIDVSKITICTSRRFN